MSQNLDAILEPHTYTRADFTALRAWVLKIPPSKIEDLYYRYDAPQLKHGIERFLQEMRRDLVERAITAKPILANALAHARQGGSLTQAALKILIEASEVKAGIPRGGDDISQWIKPKVASALLSQGIHSLNDLVEMINERGYRWWKPIPRLGEKRAEVVVKWLIKQGNSIDQIIGTALIAPVPVNSSYFREVTPENPAIVPLETIILPSLYNGSNGENRAPAKPYIKANDDLQAIDAYLIRHKGNAKTFRSYQKELERFLLWSVICQKKPISSLLVDDCETYKDFLKAPAPEFCGRSAPRFTESWRPFKTTAPSPTSQKYAIQVIRTCFAWLVDVRYLAGNPWVAVKDPVTDKKEHILQIEKALRLEVWNQLVEALDAACIGANGNQFRIARAAILLMGDSGLRRDEVAGAERINLRASQYADLWELSVLGKRSKWRTVPVSMRTIVALKQHYQDRKQPWDESDLSPLLSPLKVPRTQNAIEKHGTTIDRAHYTAHGLYRLIEATLKRIVAANEDWSAADKAAILGLSAHDFRHTFATNFVAKGGAVDVAQKILGHASISTTSIYVQAEKQRSMEEAAKYFSRIEG